MIPANMLPYTQWAVKTGLEATASGLTSHLWGISQPNAAMACSVTMDAVGKLTMLAVEALGLDPKNAAMLMGSFSLAILTGSYVARKIDRNFTPTDALKLCFAIVPMSLFFEVVSSGLKNNELKLSW